MSPSEQVPPEVLAIAIALAAVWQEAQAPEGPAAEPGRWRLAGRRWERTTGHRWS